MQPLLEEVGGVLRELAAWAAGGISGRIGGRIGGDSPVGIWLGLGLLLLLLLGRRRLCVGVHDGLAWLRGRLDGGGSRLHARRRLRARRPASLRASESRRRRGNGTGGAPRHAVEVCRAISVRQPVAIDPCLPGPVLWGERRGEGGEPAGGAGAGGAAETGSGEGGCGGGRVCERRGAGVCVGGFDEVGRGARGGAWGGEGVCGEVGVEALACGVVRCDGCAGAEGERGRAGGRAVLAEGGDSAGEGEVGCEGGEGGAAGGEGERVVGVEEGERTDAGEGGLADGVGVERVEGGIEGGRETRGRGEYVGLRGGGRAVWVGGAAGCAGGCAGVCGECGVGHAAGGVDVGGGEEHAGSEGGSQRGRRGWEEGSVRLVSEEGVNVFRPVGKEVRKRSGGVWGDGPGRDIVDRHWFEEERLTESMCILSRFSISKCGTEQFYEN